MPVRGLQLRSSNLSVYSAFKFHTAYSILVFLTQYQNTFVNSFLFHSYPYQRNWQDRNQPLSLSFNVCCNGNKSHITSILMGDSDSDDLSIKSFSGITSIGESLVPAQEAKQVSITEISLNGLLKRPLKLKEDLKEGCGGQLWPAGMVLARYMLRYHQSDLAHKTMYEQSSFTVGRREANTKRW